MYLNRGIVVFTAVDMLHSRVAGGHSLNSLLSLFERVQISQDGLACKLAGL